MEEKEMRTTKPKDLEVPEGCKWCPACRQVLPKESFGKCKSRKDGLQNKCRACAATRSTRYNVEHPEEVKASKARYRVEHPDRYAAMVGIANARKRGAVSDPFMTSSQILDATEHLYAEARRLTKETGVRHEVDHILGVKGLGWHAPWNLQVIPAVANRAKQEQDQRDAEAALRSWEQALETVGELAVVGAEGD